MSKFNCEQFKTKKARAHCEEASREHEEKFGSEKEEEEIPHDEPTRPPNSKAEKIAKLWKEVWKNKNRPLEYQVVAMMHYSVYMAMEYCKEKAEKAEEAEKKEEKAEKKTKTKKKKNLDYH